MIQTVGTMLGGLGLFLLAISMLTDGLKLAAGDALRDILTRSTSTPIRGVASGILVTGIVQSSSAVTVATIGFVNAGLLNLVQALGIVYGANIGTTMTGWLVSAIGFDFKVEVFALPLIGLGMALRLTGKATRWGAIGEALAGFGLFFVGIDVLRDAFAEVSIAFDEETLSLQDRFGLPMFVALGFLTTLLTQSSSAAIAMTLSAATANIIAIDAAASMVIGANVGTTSTAMLSVLGATPNAKRVAAAHVVFNVVTGVVALSLLPVMLALVHWLSENMDMQSIPAVTLALFHTVFNVVGVLLMWPLTKRLAAWLNQRFKTPVEALSKTVYLDKNVLVTPGLGIDALSLELKRIAELTRTMAIGSIRVSKPPPPQLTEMADAIDLLTDQVETFVSSLERDRLSKVMSERLPLALRINTYLEEITHLAREVASHFNDVEAIKTDHVAARINAFQEMLTTLISQCDVAAEDFDATSLEQGYDELRVEWHDLKSSLLYAAAGNMLPIGKLNLGLERLRSGLRIAEQSVKVAVKLQDLSSEPEDEVVVAEVAQA